MNRPVFFIEFKSSDYATPLKDIVAHGLKTANINMAHESIKDWAVYVNDRMMPSMNKSIRPRSRVLLVSRKAPPVDLQITKEAKDWLILDKPTDLPTQKTLKAFEDNLYDQVRLYFIQQKDFPQGLPYVGLHHRLDRGTSGLVLMTKQRSANKEIADLFKHRKIQKQYIALVEEGETSPPEKWRQKDFIKRGSTSKLKFFFKVSDSGDEAISEFQRVETLPGLGHKILCRPKTGRTHQLRVQLAHKGFPILGDSVYGNKKSAPRLMLHAQSLEFPYKGEIQKVESSTPFPPKL